MYKKRLRSGGKLRGNIKTKGVYLTHEEHKILKESIPHIASLKTLSKEQKEIFDKLENKIKNLDMMKKADHGSIRKYGENWLSPNEAMLLVALKKVALNRKLILRDATGSGKISRKKILNEFKKFNKEGTMSSIDNMISNLKNKRLDFEQTNVSITKTRKHGLLSDVDREIIDLKTKGLAQKDIGKKLDIKEFDVYSRIKRLRKMGFDI